MSNNYGTVLEIEGMVVVASGGSAAIQRWSDSLRRASILFLLTHTHYDDPAAPTDRGEIWVEGCNVEEARTALRSGWGG